jgi:DNA-binding LacI/PurR family transcriptional regulator
VSGILQPGDKLPDGTTIAQTLGISKTTVMKAMDILVEKGLVERRRKAGSFVAENLPVKMPSIGFFYLHESASRMSKIAEFMQRSCDTRNYDLKVISFDPDFYDTTDLLAEVKRRSLSGAVMVPLPGESCLKGLRRLEEAGFPLVQFGNSMFEGKLKAPLITGNEAKRCANAIEYLRGKGHRRIGLISCQKGSNTDIEYLTYYARERELEFEPRWLACIPFTGPAEYWPEANLAQMCDAYLAQNTDITAVMVSHPSVCRDVLLKAQAHGRRVPGELSVLSLADHATGLSSVSPAITAMWLSEKAFGECAFDTLFEIITHGFPDAPSMILLDHGIVERASVASIQA